MRLACSEYVPCRHRPPLAASSRTTHPVSKSAIDGAWGLPTGAVWRRTRLLRIAHPFVLVGRRFPIIRSPFALFGVPVSCSPFHVWPLPVSRLRRFSFPVPTVYVLRSVGVMRRFRFRFRHSHSAGALSLSFDLAFGVLRRGFGLRVAGSQPGFGIIHVEDGVRGLGMRALRWEFGVLGLAVGGWPLAIGDWFGPGVVVLPPPPPLFT